MERKMSKNLVPSNPMELLHKEVDRLFGGFFNDFSLPTLGAANGNMVPKINLKETDKEYQLEAEMPGIPSSEVQVTVENGVLTIKGEKKAEKEEKTKDYIRVERSYGSYERSFALPDNVDEAKISASGKDGVLNVCIPKKEGATHVAKKIDVTAA
jgi:HSP20 family protein